MFRPKTVCASTQRAINLIKDMFIAPDKAFKDSGAVTLFNFAALDEVICIKSVS